MVRNYVCDLVVSLCMCRSKICRKYCQIFYQSIILSLLVQISSHLSCSSEIFKGQTFLCTDMDALITAVCGHQDDCEDFQKVCCNLRNDASQVVPLWSFKTSGGRKKGNYGESIGPKFEN